MRTLYFVLISWSLLLPIHLSAQVSGYMGKRLLAKTDLGHFLLGNGAIGFQLEAEYALTRKWTASLGYKGLQMADQGLFSFRNTDSLNDFGVQALGIHFRFYGSRGLLAPKGKYWEFYLYKGRARSLGTRDEEVEQPVGPPVALFEQSSIVAPYTELGFAIGEQWVYQSRFVLDIGLGLAVAYTNQEELEVPWNAVPVVSTPRLVRLGEVRSATQPGGTYLNFRLAMGMLIY